MGDPISWEIEIPTSNQVFQCEKKKSMIFYPAFFGGYIFFIYIIFLPIRIYMEKAAPMIIWLFFGSSLIWNIFYAYFLGKSIRVLYTITDKGIFYRITNSSGFQGGIAGRLVAPDIFLVGSEEELLSEPSRQDRESYGWKWAEISKIEVDTSNRRMTFFEAKNWIGDKNALFVFYREEDYEKIKQKIDSHSIKIEYK